MEHEQIGIYLKHQYADIFRGIFVTKKNMHRQDYFVTSNKKILPDLVI